MVDSIGSYTQIQGLTNTTPKSQAVKKEAVGDVPLSDAVEISEEAEILALTGQLAENIAQNVEATLSAGSSFDDLV